MFSHRQDADFGPQPHPVGKHFDRVSPLAQPFQVLVGGLDDVGESDELLDIVARSSWITEQAGTAVRVKGDRRAVPGGGNRLRHHLTSRLDPARQ